MKRSPLAVFAGWGGLVLVTGFIIAEGGCGTTEPRNPGTGMIYVDHPQVFTRERLINRRLQEQQWLEDQLKKDAEFRLQGSIDTREFIGLAAAVKGNFDPLGGSQSQAVLQEVQRNSRVTELQDKLQIEVLKKQIELVHDITNAPSAGIATNPATLTSFASSNLIAPSAVTVNVGTFANSNLSPVPNPSNRVQSTALLTSVQTLDDKIAYRNAIQARLREQELDDTHDLAGMTLYTLKFDVSVIPGLGNSSFGQVSAYIKYDTSRLKYDEIFPLWLKSLNHELGEECLSLQRRYYMHHLTDFEQIQLMQLATELDRKAVNQLVPNVGTVLTPFSTDSFLLGLLTNNDAPWQENLSTLQSSKVSIESAKTILSKIKVQVNGLYAVFKIIHGNVTPVEAKIFGRTVETIDEGLEFLKEQQDLATKLRALGRELDNGTPPNKEGAYALAQIIRQRYSDAIGSIVDIQVPTFESLPGTTASNEYFLCWIGSVTNQQKFDERISRLGTNLIPYVVVVEPKEYAQNLSDVAARQRVLSLAASLNALLPQVGASLGFDSTFMKHSQQFLDTIRRQPLLVGFANGSTNFGWVLGPKFEINHDGARLSWSQSAIQHSVQASLVVPGWLQDLELTVTNYWLSDRALPDIKHPAGTNSFKVRLPRNFSAITRALLADSELAQSQPSILPRWDPDLSQRGITVREGDDETILVRGRDLWRNPEVYLGTQRGINVHILPDMGGLTAEFHGIRQSASAQTGPQQVDLTVLTSAGTAVLRNGVQILPRKESRMDAFASLRSTYLALGGELAFEVVPKLVPKAYGQLVLMITDTKLAASTAYMIPNENLPQGSLWKVSVPTNALGETIRNGKSQEILVDVKLRQTPKSEEQSTSVLKNAPLSIVYFASRTNAEFGLRNNVVSFPFNSALSTTNLSFFLQADDVDLFKKAFPGLEASLKDGKSWLTLTSGTEKPITNNLSGPLTGPLISALDSAMFPVGTNLLWKLQVHYSNLRMEDLVIEVGTNLSTTKR